MLTRFHFLREPATLLSALRVDGWDLHSGPGGSIGGTHPEAPDEAAARERLHELGLLTSRAVRIRFDHSRRATGA
jgi:hypothetical protein